jgi:NarL family two-component system response regulator LiaR
MLTVVVISSDEMYGGALAAALSGAPDVEDCRVEAAGSAPGPADVLVLHGEEVDSDRIARLASTAPVLVLGEGGADRMIEAVEAGAMGYLESRASFDSVTDTVRSLAKGVAAIDPAMLGALLRHVVDRRREERETRETLEVLTPRERQVFGLLARGLDSGQIADHLFISVQTVRTHTRSVMSKLDLHSRSELMALAARCGLTLESEEDRP